MSNPQAPERANKSQVCGAYAPALMWSASLPWSPLWAQECSAETSCSPCASSWAGGGGARESASKCERCEQSGEGAGRLRARHRRGREMALGLPGG